MDKNQEILRENIAILSKNIYGNWVQQVTYTFAELNIADALLVRDYTCLDLSKTLNLNSQYLGRFLRCATELSYVEFNQEIQKYRLTELGKLLSDDHPFSKKSETRLNGSPYRYEPWGNLDRIIKNGHSEKYSPTLKDGTLSFLEDKPSLLDTFHDAMLKIWKVENKDLVKEFDFSQFHTVMDIGCGTGSFLEAILESNEKTHGVMFDLKGTFDENVSINKGQKTQKMCGDFFIEIPDIADLYTMKNVIHNWPEKKVKILLQNVRKAMVSQNGSNIPIEDKRLLIIENVLPEDGSDHKANWMNLNFMILTDGAERTEKEYKTLGKECGLNLTHVYHTNVNRDILEFSIL